MSREVDRRELNANKLTSAREAELRALASRISDELHGAPLVTIVQFDAMTGNPGGVRFEWLLTVPTGEGGHIQRALALIHKISRVLGLAPGQSAEFMANSHVQATSSSAKVVHLRQQYKGIPIFESILTVRFAQDSTLTETIGRCVTVDRDLSVSSRLTIQEAVLKAAQHVAVPDEDEQEDTDPFGQPLHPEGIDLTGFEPQVISAFAHKPERPTVLEAGPFGGQIKASLTWFPLADELRLAWECALVMPNRTSQFRTLVDTSDGTILYCRQLTQS